MDELIQCVTAAELKCQTCDACVCVCVCVYQTKATKLSIGDEFSQAAPIDSDGFTARESLKQRSRRVVWNDLLVIFHEGRLARIQRHTALGSTTNTQGECPQFPGSSGQELLTIFIPV